MSAAHAHDEPGGQRARAGVFVQRGWFPFPVEYGGKRPGVGIRWGTATASVPTPKMLDLWFGRDPMNIGIAARPSGLVILDEDRLGAMVALCEAYGHPVPITYRVRTAKGWHWYFDAPDDVEIGNSPGLLKDFGFDVRGGRGDGGYVVAAGSLHETGHVYVAEDDDADTVALPWWIVGLLGAKAPAEPVNDSRPAVDRGSGLFDERRQFTYDQAREFVRPAIEELRAAGKGEINEALNRAGRMVAHFGEEFWTRAAATARLMELQLRPWHDDDESGARATIASAYASQARDEASGALDRSGQLLGWRAERRDPLEDGDAGEAKTEELTPEEVARRKRARLVAEELERLEVRAAAAQLLNPKEPLRVLRGAAFLTEGAQLTYLVRRFLYEGSTAKIYGPPGGGKTNFALDVALCAALGIDWHGVAIERCRVHFVMAEGEPVNRLRVAAFLHRHERAPQDLDDWFVAIPQGVLLTPTGVADYLEVVREDRPGLVFLDTKNAMMDGDENSASDVAVMIRAMREIRDLGERCCVALIDHTGIADESRGRGSNAVMAAMDTEIKVSKQRVAETDVFTAVVTRDKAAAEMDPATFSFTLWPQPGVERPDGVAAPPVVNTEDEVIKHLERDTGPQADDVEEIIVPSDVAGYRGEGHQMINEVAEVVLRHGRGQTGITRAEVVATLTRAVPTREKNKIRMRIYRAWDALYGMGRLEPVNPETSVLTSYTKWAVG